MEDAVLVFCVYRRLHLLQQTLQLLAAENVQIFVWDNSQDPVAVANVCRDRATVYQNKSNTGCWGWVLAAIKTNSRYVITIDDDLSWSPGTIQKLWSERRPNHIVGDWAWRVHGSYWNRERCQPGETADYVGGRGLVLDTNLLRLPKVLACPKHARLAYEDIWISRLARYYGFRLAASHAQFIEVVDRQSTWIRCYQQKSEFWLHLSQDLGLPP